GEIKEELQRRFRRRNHKRRMISRPSLEFQIPAESFGELFGAAHSRELKDWHSEFGIHGNW
ncbi:hypothetical protein U1Q18_010222, partial [Sarracenia purpurea var. burkii]